MEPFYRSVHDTSASNYLLALADLNGDGVIDFVVPTWAPAIIVSLGSISATATLAAVSIPGGGSHNVVASYAGDANSAVSVSSLISLTGSQVATSLALNISPDPASPGQAVSPDRDRYSFEQWRLYTLRQRDLL